MKPCLWILCLFALLLSACDSNAPVVPSTLVPSPTTVPVPSATAVAQRPAPSLEELLAQKKNLTDVQWDAYAASLKGASITDWSGTVSDVAQKPQVGDVSVLTVKLARPVGGVAVFDLLLDISAAGSASINKGQAVMVSGTISSVECFSNYCPIQLENARYKVK